MDESSFISFNRFNIRCLYFFSEGVMAENNFLDLIIIEGSTETLN